MSTLRISNIEAKSVPASATIDEKVKITNSSGDPLVFIDGKTSGITTVGINTTDANITFDANSNVVVTGIITATRFSGQITPTTLNVSGGVGVGDSIFHIGDDNTQIRFPAADTFTVETAGSERLRITSEGQVKLTGSNSGNHMSTFGTNVGGLTIDDVGNQHTALQVSHGSNNVFLVASSNNSVYMSSYGTGNFVLEHTGGGGTRERLRIDSSGRLRVASTTESADGAFDDVIVGNHSGNRGISILSGATSQGAIGFAKSGTLADGYVAYNHNSTATSSSMILKSSGRIQFNAGSVERLRITSDGEMGVNTTAPVEKLGISGNMRFVNPNGNISRITALPSGSYSTGTSGGAAVCFQRIADGGGGSDEIFFETHWQGNRHGESCRINKYGNLAFPSGNGIDFSATGDTGGMASELLDDYEEGSWTPEINGGYSSISYHNPRIGYYTKVGNHVSFQIYLYVYQATGASANVQITLPFTSVSNSGRETGAYTAYSNGFMSNSWNEKSGCGYLIGSNYSYLRPCKLTNGAVIYGNDTRLGTGANNQYLIICGQMFAA